jgi:23S rRNA (cytidine2498-2'-O)-methyltransferase
VARDLPVTPSNFLFAICQNGSEAALKQELAHRHPSLRFAFSRPGFVTFRLPDEAGAELHLHSVFARTWGFSLGKVAHTDQGDLTRAFWKAVVERFPAETLAQFRHLHLWQRDPKLPGDFDFDPSVAAQTQAIGELVVEQRPTLPMPRQPFLNQEARIDDLVLDCVLVEPHEWWFGWHRAKLFETRWPGGVPQIAMPERVPARAYLKIVEALLWSELPLRANDRCLEIGSAPGGWCQALLDRGCSVTGVDPAEMDPLVLANPRFTHVRARAKDVPRDVFRGVRWLLSDANVAPKYTLDMVEAIVTEPATSIEGLVLTIKLTDPALAAHIPQFNKRIRSWGYARVRARQLAFNRQEVCVVATERSY